jgi:hypothetical protein
MRITVNEEFIQRRAKIARWSSLIGLGVLLLGLIVSFNKQYYYWSLPALVIGFFLATISGFNANRYLKEPRPDQILAKVLRGFDNNYHLFNYSGPIPHILLTPSRLYALLVKPQDGVIRYQGNRWRRDFRLRRFFFLFGEEALGNPTRDARAEADRLQRVLEKEFGQEAPLVEPLVVFTHPEAQLEITESSEGEKSEVSALSGTRLKKHLRAQPKKEAFNTDLRKRLTAFLQGAEYPQDDTE